MGRALSMSITLQHLAAVFGTFLIAHNDLLMLGIAYFIQQSDVWSAPAPH
jgi:hypothetical protein